MLPCGDGQAAGLCVALSSSQKSAKAPAVSVPQGGGRSTRVISYQSIASWLCMYIITSVLGAAVPSFAASARILSSVCLQGSTAACVPSSHESTATEYLLISAISADDSWPDAFAENQNTGSVSHEWLNTSLSLRGDATARLTSSVERSISTSALLWNMVASMSFPVQELT